MNASKAVALTGLLAGGLLVQGAAQAAQCPVSATTFADLFGAATTYVCQDQDKIYTFYNDASFQLSSASSLAISTVTSGTKDLHIVSVIVNTGQTQTNASWRYTIEVDLNISPDNFIDTMDLGMTSSLPNVSGTKNAWTTGFGTGTNYQATYNHPTQGPTVNVGNVPILWIQDSVTVSNGGVWTGITNTFTEDTAVPEPTTMALLGLGLAGIAGRARRARKG